MKNRQKITLLATGIFLAAVLVVVGIFWRPEVLFQEEERESVFDQSLVFATGPMERKPLTEVDYYLQDLSIENHNEFERIVVNILPMSEKFMIGFVGNQDNENLDILLINLYNEKDGETLYSGKMELKGDFVKSFKLSFPERNMGLIKMTLDKERSYRVSGDKNAIYIDINK